MLRSLPFVFILSIISANIGSTFGQTIDTSSTDALLKLTQEFDEFRKHLAVIEGRLKTIQTTVEQRVTSDDSRCLVRDISEAIKSSKFEQAEEKLTELGDNKKISNIVRDVYAGSASNVDVILEFARALTNGETQFQVFSALRDEMSSSGQNDPNKWIGFVETLEGELILRKNATLKAKAQVVIDSAVKSLKDAATSIFKTAMINNKYQNSVEIDNLATAIFNFRTDISNEVMDKLVDSVFGVVAARRILESISSHKPIPQVIAGLTALFNRFNYAGNLNNDATIYLASHLRQLQLRDMYRGISQNFKNDVDKVIQQLPTCARNLFFHPQVCFWNKARKHYMYAASTSISHDTDRRSIYTWYEPDVRPGAAWVMEQIGDDFYFKNREHVDEFMYAANIDYNKDMRYVFTWVPGHNNDTQSAFAIELDGEFCYVRSTYFNEYLFAPALKHDKQNMYVFTWKPGTSVKTAEFQWQIRNCGQSDGKLVSRK